MTFAQCKDCKGWFASDCAVKKHQRASIYVKGKCTKTSSNDVIAHAKELSSA